MTEISYMILARVIRNSELVSFLLKVHLELQTSMVLKFSSF